MGNTKSTINLSPPFYQWEISQYRTPMATCYIVKTCKKRVGIYISVQFNTTKRKISYTGAQYISNTLECYTTISTVSLPDT